jgi:RimJ/RimL family protein N-acetyltransferase
MPVAEMLGIRQLYAFCHVMQQASCRVLEKCGFSREGLLREYAKFPNDDPTRLQDVIYYSRSWKTDREPSSAETLRKP